MNKVISTDKAPAAPNILSQAIESSGLVITSGQIHLKLDGQLVKGSTAEKTKQALLNLKEILKAADLDFSHVLKATVYVTDMNEYANFNQEYVKHFKPPFPAREVVCVK